MYPSPEPTPIHYTVLPFLICKTLSPNSPIFLFPSALYTQSILLFFFFFFFGCVGSSFSVQGLSLLVASGGHSPSRCAGLSLSRPLLLRSTGSRRAGSVVVAHGPSCSAACGIFPDQGLNLCPLHWQADSQPLRHQGSPILLLSTWSQHYFLAASKCTYFMST